MSTLPFTGGDPELRRELEQLADPGYKTVHEGLIPGSSMTYGVRLPALRALAQRVLQGDPLDFLQNSRPASYEETMVRGLVVAGLQLPWEEKRPWAEDFLPRIDNWALCDAFCNSLKPRFPGDEAELWAFARPLYSSVQEYEARFAVVLQLSRCVKEEHLEEGLFLLQQVQHPGYYAKMGVAWALSVWYVSFPQEVEALLAQRTLEPWVQNKTIQKIRESRRVRPEEKEALLRYKR